MAITPPPYCESRYTEAGFAPHQLDENHKLFIGRLPNAHRLNNHDFESLWNMHPLGFSEILMHGKLVALPRYQQAYGVDYHFSGQDSRALPVPPVLVGIHKWAQSVIDERLNGILANWYDGTLGHYIGPHRDSVANMVKGAPIVTVSLGETRVFRVAPWKGHGNLDFEVVDGSVIVMPYNTNLRFTHAIPRRTAYRGKRISITLRAFGN